MSDFFIIQSCTDKLIRKMSPEDKWPCKPLILRVLYVYTVFVVVCYYNIAMETTRFNEIPLVHQGNNKLLKTATALHTLKVCCFAGFSCFTFFCCVSGFNPSSRISVGCCAWTTVGTAHYRRQGATK